MMEETNLVRISRILSGEAGGEERVAFQKELEINSALKSDYLECQNIWANSKEALGSNWDTNQAWQRFVSGTITPQAEIRPTQTINLKWAVAAAVVLAITTLLWLWNNGKTNTYAYNENSTEPLILSDGSKIYLNRGATVDVYPFRKKKRRVVLHGEAFFEISPDPSRPFIVEAGETITEVVGTAFNITQTTENTRIFVQQGKVIFKSSDKIKEVLALTAGEAAIFNDHRMELIPNPSPNINAWHTQRLAFTRNMSLGDILADASSFFHCRISLENVELKDCHISNALSYNHPEINAVLKPLASFINGSIKIENGAYTILGGQCP